MEHLIHENLFFSVIPFLDVLGVAYLSSMKKKNSYEI